MTYVALLRGINVGGKAKVEMAKLKVTFEKLGFKSVKTYINSGNVIFTAGSSDRQKLCKQIETAIEKDFGLSVPVLLRDFDEIEGLAKAIPESWINDQNMKCDVMFLWPDMDSPKVLKQLPTNPKVEDVKYFPGAIVWRINRGKVTKSRLTRLVGTSLYKQVTIRNSNTVRKLYSIMQ